MGRHIDNDVIFAGEDVLDFHLRIEIHERGPELIPLGNATYSLNGREMESAFGVIPGDVVGIGATTVQIGVKRETTDGIRAWVSQDDVGERVHDVQDDLLISRHPECGLQIESEHVSRLHARLVQVAGALWIQNLASANGTAVNQRTIRGGCRLLHGDEIRFDEIRLRLRDIGEDRTARFPG
ncbi:MAG: FHA domain-containing protein [Gammaproteobacteria bacterium]|nr:FHA domain-containing protein [Gammaproteobacteria bacterium]